MSEVIDVKPESVENVPVDELESIRNAALEAIKKADGFVLFAFANGEVQLQDGSKITVPKNMLGSPGALGGGSVSLAYVATKSKALLDSENEMRNRQQAAISE
jgi:hypothetical protein